MKKVAIKGSTVINLLLVAVFLVLLFSPDAKAGLMSGLIKIGLYKPDITKSGNTANIGGEVKFSDGNGKVIHLSDLKGKVVFINFWATWCPPCRAEMPSINDLHKKYGTNAEVVFITVDADNNYQKAKKFLDRKKYDFPLYTVASEVPAELFAGKLPTTVVLDKHGKVAFRHEGMADYSDKRFYDFMNGLLQPAR
jgi:thiol-disulfide isomerase/thioredoxin